MAARRNRSRQGKVWVDQFRADGWISFRAMQAEDLPLRERCLGQGRSYETRFGELEKVPSKSHCESPFGGES